MLMSKSVDNAAAREAGKRAMAVEAYSRALRQLPTILADNAGFDSSELVSNLRSAHYKGFSSYGLGELNIASSLIQYRFDKRYYIGCARPWNYRKLSPQKEGSIQCERSSGTINPR